MKLMTHLTQAFIVLMCLLGVAANATEQLVQAYGELPQVRSVSVSPNGKFYAYIQRIDNDEFLSVVDIDANKVVGGVNATKMKARSAYFATDNHVILVVSETRSSVTFGGLKWEQQIAVSYQIDSGKMNVLLGNHDELFPLQSGMSRIVAINRDRQEVYMPARIGVREPTIDLLRVKLDSGRGQRFKKGTEHTDDWFVTNEGTVLARIDFNEKTKVHSLYSYLSGKPKVVYEEVTDIPRVGFRAITDDEQSIVFVDPTQDGDAVRQISLVDGAISEPLLTSKDRDLEVARAGTDRRYVGAIESGPVTTYHLEDKQRADIRAALEATFSQSTVGVVSSSFDEQQLIVKVSGNEGADDYYLFSPAARSMSRIAQGYPQIEPSMIGRVEAVNYTARDGLNIPAILTWPVGYTPSDQAPMLPTLVFPHGGPQAHDTIRFDYWAQFFARKGYLVLQPNFRGSTGFGNAHEAAGHRQWGQAMQDDVSDGVHYLVEQGFADPDRVCIMGASYGGYSALAGGAFSPELYRCVISVAGVADLPMMLRNVKQRGGRNNWVNDHWKKLIGDNKKERDFVTAISPAYSVKQFQAPVLLIHGKDDIVVPISQSKRMQSALRKANKPVELVELKGEDHWLSSSETRLAMLQAIDAFLKTHNPV